MRGGPHAMLLGLAELQFLLPVLPPAARYSEQRANAHFTII